jgi:hypothetical protein
MKDRLCHIFDKASIISQTTTLSYIKHSLNEGPSILRPQVSSLVFSTFQKSTKFHQGAPDGTGGVVHNSFMTTAQIAAIQKAKAEQSEIYRLQREIPHYIVPIGGGKVTFKRSDEQFIPTSTCLSTEDLLKEVDEVIESKGKRAAPAAQPDPPASAGGKGKRALKDLLRQGDAKYPKTDGSDNSGPGESSSQGPRTNRKPDI